MAVCVQYQPVYLRAARFSATAPMQFMAALLVLSVLLVRVWIRSEVTELGYELSDLRSNTVQLDMERRELELQLSVLRRPDALAERARKELGFVELRPEQLRKIAVRVQ